MPRWPKIYCNRPGFRMDCLHTKKQFLRTIRNGDEYFTIIYRRMNGDIGVPLGKIKRNDLYSWMEYLDAYFIV